MRTIFFTLTVALFATLALNAQQISVVSPAGATTLYTDLNLAIQGAAPGSTVYLSGGGFQVNDTTKITKRLTIIGIGHRPDNDNADGNTNVSGNLFFNDGSDNCALMGVHLSGTIFIANDNQTVNNILIRYCNFLDMRIGNYTITSSYSDGSVFSIGGSGAVCQDVVINQNYIRNGINGGQCAITLTNNILGDDLNFVNGGTIENNVFLNHGGSNIVILVQNSQVRNNVFNSGNFHNNDNTVFFGNYAINNLGADNTQIDWETIFTGPNNGVNVSSNFHLAGGNNGIGIYGGTGFSDTALPPIPRIVSKSVAEQTDENGKLKVQVRVKAQ
jgi:hypothetical protein